jgi:hypothetical protein
VREVAGERSHVSGLAGTEGERNPIVCTVVGVVPRTAENALILLAKG